MLEDAFSQATATANANATSNSNSNSNHPSTVLLGRLLARGSAVGGVCVAVCCNLFQSVAVYCSLLRLEVLLEVCVLQYVAVRFSLLQSIAVGCSVLQCVARGSAVGGVCVAVCRNLLQSAAVCCSLLHVKVLLQVYVLQPAAICFSLQSVARGSAIAGVCDAVCCNLFQDPKKTGLNILIRNSILLEQERLVRIRMWALLTRIAAQDRVRGHCIVTRRRRAQTPIRTSTTVGRRRQAIVTHLVAGAIL